MPKMAGFHPGEREKGEGEREREREERESMHVIFLHCSASDQF